MIYGAKLPRYTTQPNHGNCCFCLSFVLSVLAHLLFYWFLINHQEKPAAIASAKPQQSLEVTLSAAPKAKSSAAQKSAQAEPSPPTPPQPTPPPTPKPTPKPKETKPVKQPVRKPIPKPIVPKRPEPPTEETLPEPPKPRKPVVKPKPEKEPLPEFKDDFASLSKDYSNEKPEPQGAETSGSNPAQSDNGVHTGAILNINPKIQYPIQAQKMGMQGTVKVRIHINPDGTTDKVDLLQSSGYDLLDDMVLGSVQHWRFKPPMRGGIPVKGVFDFIQGFGGDEDREFDWQAAEVKPATE